MTTQLSYEAECLIETYGNQAYWKAVEIATMAVCVGDKSIVKTFADAAKELMEAGYHKHPKAPKP